MKYFSMFSSINKELFEKFVTFYNSYSDEDCTIVLNTGGGDGYVAETIIHMINEMKKVSLIIEAAYSAGFNIAISVKAKKYLSKTAKGMWHYSTTSITYNHKAEPCYLEDKCMIKNLPIDKVYGQKIAEKIMTKKELKRYNKDKDIYFDFKRMKQIFPNAKIL